MICDTDLLKFLCQSNQPVLVARILQRLTFFDGSKNEFSIAAFQILLRGVNLKDEVFEPVKLHELLVLKTGSAAFKLEVRESLAIFCGNMLSDSYFEREDLPTNAFVDFLSDCSIFECLYSLVESNRSLVIWCLTCISRFANYLCQAKEFVEKSLDLLGLIYEADLQKSVEIMLNWLRALQSSNTDKDELAAQILDHIRLSELLDKGFNEFDCVETRIDTIKLFGTILGLPGSGLFLTKLPLEDLVNHLSSVLFSDFRELYYEALVDKEPID